MDLGGLRGVGGFLGADQMSRFGSVVFDYSGGRILLGAHGCGSDGVVAV